MKQIFAILGIAILLNSCSSTTINLGEYEPVPLKKAEIHPPNKRMTLVVFNLDDSFNRISKESRLGFSMAEQLKSKLIQTKQVEVIKRNATLREEIYRYKEDYKSAQYLLVGQITDATYENTFYPPEKNFDSAIVYKACIEGTINLIKLPSMIMRESFDFHDKCSRDLKKTIFTQNMKESNPALLRKNITDILDDIVPRMQKYFRPQGYVRGMRKKDNKIILQTTLSSDLGAIEGRDVEILRLEKHHDEIKGIDYNIERKIGEGEITSNITSEYSFIMIDSLSETPKIGDVVRVSK